jgi:hypothetical protein
MREPLTGAMTKKVKLKLKWIHPLLDFLNSIIENAKCVHSTKQVTLGLIRTPQAVVAATTGERRRGEKRRDEERSEEERSGEERSEEERRGKRREEKRREERMRGKEERRRVE